MDDDNVDDDFAIELSGDECETPAAKSKKTDVRKVGRLVLCLIIACSGAAGLWHNIKEYLHEVEEFKSGRAKTYYDYILKFRKLPDNSRSMKQLRAEIDRAIDDGSDDPDFAIEDMPTPKPKAKPKPLPIDDGFAVEDPCDLPGPVGPIEVPAGLPLPDPAPPEAAPGSPLPPAAPASPAHPPEPMQIDAGGDWPAELEGVPLLKLAGRDEMRVRYHGRLKVVCPVHGPSCHKSRSVQLFRDRLGDRAALYYLGAWLQKALTMDEHDHFTFKPELPDMQAYKASHDPHG